MTSWRRSGRRVRWSRGPASGRRGGPGSRRGGWAGRWDRSSWVVVLRSSGGCGSYVERAPGRFRPGGYPSWCAGEQKSREPFRFTAPGPRLRDPRCHLLIVSAGSLGARPPHGGAAHAYTSTRTRWCESSGGEDAGRGVRSSTLRLPRNRNATPVAVAAPARPAPAPLRRPARAGSTRRRSAP